MSVADRLRQTISTSRTSTSDKAIVRPLNEDEKERKTPPSTSPPDIKTDFVETGDGDAKPSYFDDRLREMREQKRRDKRARKMARRAEEKAALKAAKVGGSWD